MKVGVVTFPGSLDDVDARRAVRLAGARGGRRCGTPTTTCGGVDAVVLPGGFSYGDYLRCGAIARFSPVMTEVVAARRGGPAGARHLQRLPDPLRGHLLPGALVRNDRTQFVCRDQRLRIESTAHPLDRRRTPPARRSSSR